MVDSIKYTQLYKWQLDPDSRHISKMKLFVTFFIYTFGKTIGKQISADTHVRVRVRGVKIFSEIFKREESSSLVPNHHHSFDPINQRLPQLDPRFPSGMNQIF